MDQVGEGRCDGLGDQSEPGLEVKEAQHPHQDHEDAGVAGQGWGKTV